ncbi:hypothetical protein HMPREF9466_02342 [Fusobacterium necrophorum subsp. funduliforme 1_1_36S]|nr:hypothetical protein HMPREF9466_02342 [Fusobacterium necrophorum subsp. funduliforme 1_1_36S]
MMYYQVYLEKNRGLYTYVDEKEEYRIGDSVFVSFRNQKQVAYIIALDSRQEFPFRVLPILAKNGFSKYTSSFSAVSSLDGKILC